MTMPSPSIVNLPCGCFFSGRSMIVSQDCEEHEESEWACDNCGETAMDGGDRCVTCRAPIPEECTPCDNCGGPFPIDELDGKPTINSKLRRIRAREGQLVMLRRAADLGFDFNRLECRKCYGPGYSAI